MVLPVLLFLLGAHVHVPEYREYRGTSVQVKLGCASLVPQARSFFSWRRTRKRLFKGGCRRSQGWECCLCGWKVKKVPIKVRRGGKRRGAARVSVWGGLRVDWNLSPYDSAVT